MSSEPLVSLYVAKLEQRRPFSESARKAFLALPGREEQVPANSYVINEGERPTRSCLVKDGFVSRSKSLRDGQRQITAFHLRGDMVDLHSALVMVADDSIYAHAPSTIVTFAHSDLLELAQKHPEIGRALWFDTLVDSAMFRQWTLNVGRRSAVSATGHLLLELHYRFKAAGLCGNHSFKLPVSQADLADALGISAVHMNRSLQTLRGEQLIRTSRKTIFIENMAGLIELAEFDPMYMHPEGPRQLRGHAPPAEAA